MGDRCNNAFVFQSLFVVVAAAARSLSFHFLCTSVCFCGSRLPTELNKRTDKQTVYIFISFSSRIYRIISEYIKDANSPVHRPRSENETIDCCLTSLQSRLKVTLPATICYRGWEETKGLGLESQVRAWILVRMGCPECLEQELCLNCLPFTLLWCSFMFRLLAFLLVRLLVQTYNCLAFPCSPGCFATFFVSSLIASYLYSQLCPVIQVIQITLHIAHYTTENEHLSLSSSLKCAPLEF